MLPFDRRTAACLLFAALAGLGTDAKADTLNGAMLINWNPNYLYGGPSYVPGLYYWNNGSGDGTFANIGWCLLGGSQCGMQNAPGRIPFFSTPYLTAPTDMYFSSAGQPMRLTLDLALTNQKSGNGGADFIGYYLTDVTGTQISSPTILFSSNQPSGSTAALPALLSGQNYAFFIENVQGYGTNAQQTSYSFYMNSPANTSTGSMPADSLQHFSIFEAGATFYIGAVDGNVCDGTFTVNNSPCIPSSEFDFNDMVVEISPVSAAEPGPAGLLGLGIVVIGVAARRRLYSVLL